MRKKCADQVSIFNLFSNHDVGKELKDICDTGRRGLPAEQVLRCALLKQ